MDALFTYLTQARDLEVGVVRNALVADYVTSGARSNPKALQGHLPRRTTSGTADEAGRSLVQRQERHQGRPPASLVAERSMPNLPLPLSS